MKIKILSWNIWGGRHLSEIISFVKDADADIVGLQEVVGEKIENTATIIAKKLGYKNVAYVMAMKMEMGGKRVNLGNAVISKYPIIKSKAHTLSVTKSRVVIEAVIQVENRTLHVFNTHLVHSHQEPFAVQEEQAANLLKVLPKNNTVLMGDFNALPKSAAIRKIKEFLKDTGGDFNIPTWSVYPEGCGVCLPQAVQFKLDYIFTTEDLKSEAFTVGQSRGSDHLPISAIIEV